MNCIAITFLHENCQPMFKNFQERDVFRRTSTTKNNPLFSGNIKSVYPGAH